MWNREVITNSDDGSGFTVLKLPSATRNISTKMNKSTSCVLSAKNVYAIAGNIISVIEYHGSFAVIQNLNMALPVMEFQDQGYKIRKKFA